MRELLYKKNETFSIDSWKGIKSKLKESREEACHIGIRLQLEIPP